MSLYEANAHDAQNAAPLLDTGTGQRLLLLRERNRMQQGTPTWSDVDFALGLFDRVRKRVAS